MFTIRQVHPEGCDFLWAVRFVSCEIDRRCSQSTTDDRPPPRILVAELENGEQLCIDSGSVYVMNDNGKTVAKYDLGGWAEPQDEGVLAELAA